MHSQCQFFHSFSVIFFSQASDINFTPVSPNRKFRFLASLCTKVYEKGDMHFENWELNVGKRTKNSIRKFKQFCCQKGVDKKARRQHKTNANLVSKFWQPCRHSLWNPHQKDRCSDVCVWQSHPPGSGVAGVHVRGLLGCWRGGLGRQPAREVSPGAFRPTRRFAVHSSLRRRGGPAPFGTSPCPSAQAGLAAPFGLPPTQRSALHKPIRPPAALVCPTGWLVKGTAPSAALSGVHPAIPRCSMAGSSPARHNVGSLALGSICNGEGVGKRETLALALPQPALWQSGLGALLCRVVP